MNAVLADDELDAIAAEWRLKLSPGFEKKLRREGKDTAAARRATAYLLQGHYHFLHGTQERFDSEYADLLHRLFGEGLVDINATFSWNGDSSPARGYVYHKLFVEKSCYPLVELVLSEVKDAIVRAPIPCRLDEPVDPLIFSILGFDGNALLQCLLADGRLDPWTQKNLDGKGFFEAVEVDSEIIWKDWEENSPFNPDGIKKLDGRAKILIDAGVPMKVPNTRGLADILAQCERDWQAVCDGSYPLAEMDAKTARQLGSRYGYSNLFDPAIWRGREAQALQLIAQLPEWTHPFMTREMAALQPAGQPSWVARTSLAAKATERGAA